MKTFFKLVVPFGLALGILFLEGAVTHVEGATCSGKTVSRKNENVSGIMVKAMRLGALIAETTTTSDGRFSLEIPKGPAIDLLFAAPGWRESILVNLSGNEPQDIAKVVVRESEPAGTLDIEMQKIAKKYIASLPSRQ